MEIMNIYKLGNVVQWNTDDAPEDKGALFAIIREYEDSICPEGVCIKGNAKWAKGTIIPIIMGNGWETIEVDAKK